MVNDDVDFLVSVEAGKLHLESQINMRKEIMEQLQRVKAQLDGRAAKVSFYPFVVQCTLRICISSGRLNVRHICEVCTYLTLIYIA